MTFDLSTHVVAGHNETLEWCENVINGLDYYTYRPATDLVQSRNAHLTNVMHYRAHQTDI